jgi:hypothetical protein
MSHTSRIAVIGAHHFPEVDLFVEQAAVALLFAQGERLTVCYRQAVRATELADQIVSTRRGRP